MRHKTIAVLTVFALTALLIGVAAGPRPEPGAGRHAESCACEFGGLRPQDPRVAAGIIDQAATLGSDARLNIYSALAQNPTISADTELRLLAAARTLSGDAREQLLIELATSPRWGTTGGGAD